MSFSTVQCACGVTIESCVKWKALMAADGITKHKCPSCGREVDI